MGQRFALLWPTAWDILPCSDPQYGSRVCSALTHSMGQGFALHWPTVGQGFALTDAHYGSRIFAALTHAMGQRFALLWTTLCVKGLSCSDPHYGSRVCLALTHSIGRWIHFCPKGTIKYILPKMTSNQTNHLYEHNYNIFYYYSNWTIKECKIWIFFAILQTALLKQNFQTCLALMTLSWVINTSLPSCGRKWYSWGGRLWTSDLSCDQRRTLESCSVTQFVASIRT